jgi:enolase
MVSCSIRSVVAREILDSRGAPTVEVDVYLHDGSFGRASVPSGASVGTHEAVELRDRDEARFHGLGVLQALRQIREVIAPWLLGRDARDQESLDRGLCGLDGTKDKSFLGANSILAVSMAVAKAAAMSLGQPLSRYAASWLPEDLVSTSPIFFPVPLCNILNGGLHADNGLSIQEFMIFPPEARSFPEAMRAVAEVYRSLKSILLARGWGVNVGDEGGFAPSVSSVEDALDVVIEAIALAGYEPGKDLAIALDVAASEWYRSGLYHDLVAPGVASTAGDLIDWYRSLAMRYPIRLIEDPLAEDDWLGWTEATRRLDPILLVGDDLFASHRQRLVHGISVGAAGAVLLKLNQVGTLTEALETLIASRREGYKVVMSHRSGETEDTTIADLAVAWGAHAIKAGAPCRSDRTAKYNQLLRLAESLESEASMYPLCVWQEAFGQEEQGC